MSLVPMQKPYGKIKKYISYLVDALTMRLLSSFNAMKLSTNKLKIILVISVLLLCIMVTVSAVGVLVHRADDIGNPCLSPECFSQFYNLFQTPLVIFLEGLTIIAFLSAAIAAIVALQNYEVSVKSTALSSYITHLNLFREYASSEATRLDLTFEQSIDSFKWYRCMFPDSAEGVFDVGKEYIHLIRQLKTELDISSNSYSGTIPKTFTNSDHQFRIRRALYSVGVTILINEQKLFFEKERAACQLIDSVNMAFATSDKSKTKLPELAVQAAYD